MKNLFVEAMEKEVAWKKTENGQDALNTTFDACLDLFSTIGALRSRSKSEITTKFAKAYAENALVAMKMVFYARDIEQGLGERNTFKVILNYLGNAHPKDVIANLENIVKFGRFDDLYALVGTLAEKDAFAYMYKVFESDLSAYTNGKPMTLAAKWLKSVNTSSKESNKLGCMTAKAFGLTVAEYRKSLAKMRARIKVLEQEISAGKWDNIDFTIVPGGAMKKYNKAFYRHQEERFTDYLTALKENKTVKVVKADGTVVEKEAKINTKHLFPYEIIEKYVDNYNFTTNGVKNSLEAMWNGIEDYVDGADVSSIVIADVSGSMYGRPMATSVGLAIYFAERNKGPFRNKFITFSTNPTWISLPENSTLSDKINITAKADWDGSTNLEAALDLVLNTAVKYRLAQEDLPKSLVIITDMEFNQCVSDNHSYASYWNATATKMTFYDTMKNKYASYGYTIPEIVFWNVNARNDTYHTTANVPHVRMVSGQAASVFKSLIDGKTHTPYEFMLEVLGNARYDCVVHIE